MWKTAKSALNSPQKASDQRGSKLAIASHKRDPNYLVTLVEPA